MMNELSKNELQVALNKVCFLMVYRVSLFGGRCAQNLFKNLSFKMSIYKGWHKRNNNLFQK